MKASFLFTMLFLYFPAYSGIWDDVRVLERGETSGHNLILSRDGVKAYSYADEFGFIVFSKSQVYRANSVGYEYADTSGIYVADFLEADPDFVCYTEEVERPFLDPVVLSEEKNTARPIVMDWAVEQTVINQFPNEAQLQFYLYSLFAFVSTAYLQDGFVLNLGTILFENSYPGGFPTSNSTSLYNILYGMSSIDHSTLVGDGLVYLTSRFGGGLAWGEGYLCNYVGLYAAHSVAHVDAITLPFPLYHWDAHVIAHEFGHTLTMKHTHSCTLADPVTNQPPDGCGGVEGSCLQGPIPTFGTIMSYCHQPGMPGIDFEEAFHPLNVQWAINSFNTFCVPLVIEQIEINCMDDKIEVTVAGENKGLTLENLTGDTVGHFASTQSVYTFNPPGPGYYRAHSEGVYSDYCYFNPLPGIRLDGGILKIRGEGHLFVFDIVGRPVMSGEVAGYREFPFTAPPGLYVIQFGMESIKMILL